MRQPRVIASWIATGVLTVVSAVAIVAATAGPVRASTSSNAATLHVATAATATATSSTNASPTLGRVVTYHDDSNTTNN